MEALAEDDHNDENKCDEEKDIINPYEKAQPMLNNENTGAQRAKTRRGSTCKQLRPLTTFVKSDNQNCENIAEKVYIIKVMIEHIFSLLEIYSQENMTDVEEEQNKKLYEEILATDFPEENMKDKNFRDKVTELGKTL